MPSHSDVRHLPWRAEQMYALVADVARYPEFIPWIHAVRIRDANAADMHADVIVGYKGLREQFTSHVHFEPHQRIYIDYVAGPLKHLHNEWRFEDVGEGCRVHFNVDFSFKNSMFEMMAAQLFESGVRKLTAAFEDRATALYGNNNDKANNVA